MVKYMFQLPTDEDFEMLYGNLKTQGTISFWSTSFLRGPTFDNCILIVDEFQNANFHELSSIITRVGENCKIMFCGDASQSDLIRTNERNGIIDFMRILRIMPSFDITEFGIEDVVRSSFVKEFLIANKFGKLIGDFEIDSSEIGNILTQDKSGFLTNIVSHLPASLHVIEINDRLETKLYWD